MNIIRLPCVKGAPPQAVRDCFRDRTDFYNPSVTLTRATSLYTREAFPVTAFIGKLKFIISFQNSNNIRKSFIHGAYSFSSFVVNPYPSRGGYQPPAFCLLRIKTDFCYRFVTELLPFCNRLLKNNDV